MALIVGTDGNDILVSTVNNADDTFIGGLGDDVMNNSGGATRSGNDTFVFNVSYTAPQPAPTAPQSFEEFSGGGTLTQNEYIAQYKAWLQYLVHGEAGGFVGLKNIDAFADAFADNTDVSWKQNSTDLPRLGDMSAEQLSMIFGGSSALAVQTGKTTQERQVATLDTDFWGAYAVGTPAIATSNDGHDTIYNFSFSPANNEDTLKFFGLDGVVTDLASFDTYFDVQIGAQLNTIDNQANKWDARLSLADGSWSVLLVDVYEGREPTQAEVLADLYGASVFA
jgi:hypothetical protein